MRNLLVTALAATLAATAPVAAQPAAASPDPAAAPVVADPPASPPAVALPPPVEDPGVRAQRLHTASTAMLTLAGASAVMAIVLYGSQTDQQRGPDTGSLVFGLASVASLGIGLALHAESRVIHVAPAVGSGAVGLAFSGRL